MTRPFSFGSIGWMGQYTAPAYPQAGLVFHGDVSYPDSAVLNTSGQLTTWKNMRVGGGTDMVAFSPLAYPTALGLPEINMQADGLVATLPGFLGGPVTMFLAVKALSTLPTIEYVSPFKIGNTATNDFFMLFIKNGNTILIGASDGGGKYDGISGSYTYDAYNTVTLNSSTPAEPVANCAIFGPMGSQGGSGNGYFVEKQFNQLFCGSGNYALKAMLVYNRYMTTLEYNSIINTMRSRLNHF